MICPFPGAFACEYGADFHDAVRRLQHRLLRFDHPVVALSRDAAGAGVPYLSTHNPTLELGVRNNDGTGYNGVWCY